MIDSPAAPRGRRRPGGDAAIESASPAPPDPYSPEIRTALLLTGTGTAGAYHAGVLRALHEAGIKIDLVGGHGIGAIGAMFAAVDGAQRLWDDKGFWRDRAVSALYPWRMLLRVAAWALALSAAIVALPIGTIAVGLVVYPIDFVWRMVGSRSEGLVGRYLAFTQAAFAPGGLPTWLPRLVVLVLGSVVLIGLMTAWAAGGRRRHRGAFWWRMLPSPLSTAPAVAHSWRAMWDLLRGAAQLKEPSPLELCRRFIELVTENLGQPGVRELLLAVHDLDAHRDLVFALVADERRQALYRGWPGRPGAAARQEDGPPHPAPHGTPESREAEARRAEVFDLSGVARDYLPDVVAGALAVPVASEPSALRFAPDAYWRGETHRLCDRPGIVARLLEELIELGAEQILIVSAAPDARGPHSLSPPRLDGRGRLGQYLESAEAAAVRDALHLAGRRPIRIFPIRPAHNPIGPFDFAGGFDDRSDRRQPLEELLARGYEDAYHQFIDPVVGASGERVGR
ncbi:MAG: patatin-like phospholipase family protein [Acidobacteriota bacterium]